MSNSSPARPPINSLIREKRNMSTIKTAWSISRDGLSCDFSIASLNASRFGRPVRLSRSISARSVRSACTSTVRSTTLSRQRGAPEGPLREGCKLEAEEVRRDALTVAEIQFACRLLPFEECMQKVRNRSGFQTIGLIPIERRAGGTLNRVDEALVVRFNLQRSIRQPLDDRSGNREGTEQANTIHERDVRFRVRSVRPPLPWSSGKAGNCLHQCGFAREGLILSC